MADSPFLAPGIQFAWDSTSLGWFKECPRKYYYQMVEGWRPKGESVHLTFGIWYHNALELYDKCRAGVADGETMDHESAVRYVVRQSLIDTWRPESVDPVTGELTPAGPWVSTHNLKTRENLIRSIVWYLEQFGENDVAKTVILQNGRPAVELSFRFEVDESLILSGHLDRVVEYMGGYYVMDRKTSTTTLSSYYFDQYAPDNQMSLYSYAANVIYQTPVRGVIIDAVQIAVGFSRFERGMTYRTPAQLDEWIDATHSFVDAAHVCGHKMERLGEAAFPQNDKSCHKYGGCPFIPICSRDPQVRRIFLESDYVRHPWNPLESR